MIYTEFFKICIFLLPSCSISSIYIIKFFVGSFAGYIHHIVLSGQKGRKLPRSFARFSTTTCRSIGRWRCKSRKGVQKTYQENGRNFWSLSGKLFRIMKFQFAPFKIFLFLKVWYPDVDCNCIFSGSYSLQMYAS